jgi:hypothetical protein
MNFLQRIFIKHTRQEEKDHNFQKVGVCYEASISFNTSFLVHFYDASNKPHLLEKSGKYFSYNENIPFQRSTVYFRVHVFNHLRLLEQTIVITIKVRNEIAIEKTFAVSAQNNIADWHSVKASLI